jgi:hypothetical protein
MRKYHLKQSIFKCKLYKNSYIYKCYLKKHVFEKHPKNNKEIARSAMLKRIQNHIVVHLKKNA